MSLGRPRAGPRPRHLQSVIGDEYRRAAAQAVCSVQRDGVQVVVVEMPVDCEQMLGARDPAHERAIRRGKPSALAIDHRPLCPDV